MLFDREGAPDRGVVVLRQGEKRLLARVPAADRATLAVLTGAALSARLLPEVLGPAGLGLALVALAGAGTLAVLADRLG